MSSSTQKPSTTAFETALAEFQSELRTKDKHKYRYTTFGDVKVEIEDIQTKLMRQRRGKHLMRLKSFLEAVDNFGKVIEVFGNASLLVAFVWGPMKFLLQIASSWAVALDDLVGVYERIGDSFPQYVQLERVFWKDSDMIKYLVLLYKDILSFHALALRYFQQPLLQQLFHATWKTYKTRFTPVLEDIERHGAQLHVQTTLSHIRQERDEEQKQRTREIYVWLRGGTLDARNDIENDHDHYVNICKESSKTFAESNRWVLGKRAMQEWIDPSSLMIPPSLWMNGMPGAGKTILSSFIIEEVKRAYPKSAVLFFYCKQDNDDRNSFSNIGRHFLAEMLKLNHDLLFSVFDEKYSQQNMEPVLKKVKDIEELLRIAILNCPSVYIVIDGIDECPRDDRKKIVQWFRELVDNLIPQDQERVRCLFVSQDDGPARRDFSGLVSLKIERNDNTRDIASFAGTESRRIQAEFGLDAALTADIATKISTAADGMFLLARLIVSNLMDQVDAEQIELELEDENLPRKLDEAYSRIFSRIFDQSSEPRREATRTLLGWLICARRTLKWHEIQCAKAIDVDSQIVDWEKRRFRVSPKDLCGPLVEIRDDGAVDFVYNTARLFVGSGRCADIEAEAAHLSLASLSIDYLNMPGFRIDCDVHKSLIPMGFYGFMDYAVASWLRHVEESVDGKSENDQNESGIAGLTESIEVLLDIHFVPTVSETRLQPVSKGNERRLKVFETQAFFDTLQRVVILLRKELAFHGKMKDFEIPLDLTEIVARVRRVLEQLYVESLSDQQSNNTLISMYGSKIFKCSRLTCRFFYEGFKTAAERDRHHSRHERPFRCMVFGCLFYSVGFETLANAQKHIKQTHNLSDDDAATFPDMGEIVEDHLTKPSETAKKRPATMESKAKTTKTAKRPRITEWRCPHCQKIFKKKFNMDSHVLTHIDKRNFVCGTCGASFSRLNDCLRHERTHASREYVCGGLLPDRNSWGCGAKFSRLDTLQQHHKSLAGQACTAPKQQSGFMPTDFSS